MKHRGRRLQVLPIRSLVPNILTVLALCAGMSSIRFALNERWEVAFWAVFVAGLLDAVDGRVARLLKGTSKFGAELDSLSDMISFGVAPAVLLYLWVMNEIGGLGWALCLVFTVCCALRLARFNTSIGDEDAVKAASPDFFVGVPAPMAAGLALWPIVLTFQFDSDLFRSPAWVGPYIGLVSFLMVSQVQTFSFKRLRIRGELVLPTLIFVCLFTALLTVYPWGTISTIGVAYLLCIPFSMRAARKKLEQAGAVRPGPEAENVSSISSGSKKN